MPLVKVKIMELLIIIMIIYVKETLQITNGSIPLTDKPYMVYLLKAPETKSPFHAAQNPTGWTCGGAIIHPLYILTSTICLADIEQVYVISGYRHYIGDERLNSDDCLLKMRKRIVSHCRLETVDYDASTFAKMYYGAPKWVKKDMATAKVDTPFNFHDKNYLTFCSYKPAMIRVNYVPKYEAPGTVAMALGWGHEVYYRKIHDVKDYNVQNLRYTTSVVIEKEKCALAYTPNEDSESFKKSIMESGLCTFGPGNVDSDGVPTHYQDLWQQAYNATYKEKNSIYYSWDRKSLQSNRTNKGKPKRRNSKSLRKQMNEPNDEISEGLLNEGESVTAMTDEDVSYEDGVTKTNKHVLHQHTFELDNPSEESETTTKSTTVKKTDKTTKAKTTTKVEKTTKLEKTTKVEKTTKEVQTTKAENTTKAGETTPGGETGPTTWEKSPWAMTGKPGLGPGLGNGICQNDHGGPLVTWIGGHERVIGVATAFKVTRKMECKGPFLYASTTAASQLIMCTINKKERRRSLGCDEMELTKKGLRIIEDTVSWEGHPDAPKKVVRELNEDEYQFLDDWYDS